MSTVHVPAPRVALGVTRRSYPSLLLRAQAVQAAIAGNATLLPAVEPTPAVLLGQVQTLAAAQQRTDAKQPGASADRNAAATILLTSLGAIRTYVQGLCDASPEKAAQLVAAASMSIITWTPPHKPAIAATLGVVSGSVRLRANKQALVGKTAAMCTFNWEYSVDGQKTWVATLGTPLAETVVIGLPALATVWFRVSVTAKKETGPPCQPAGVIVH